MPLQAPEPQLQLLDIQQTPHPSVSHPHNQLPFQRPVSCARSPDLGVSSLLPHSWFHSDLRGRDLPLQRRPGQPLSFQSHCFLQSPLACVTTRASKPPSATSLQRRLSQGQPKHLIFMPSSPSSSEHTTLPDTLSLVTRDHLTLPTVHSSTRLLPLLLPLECWVLPLPSLPSRSTHPVSSVSDVSISVKSPPSNRSWSFLPSSVRRLLNSEYSNVSPGTQFSCDLSPSVTRTVSSLRTRTVSYDCLGPRPVLTQ